jgi:hypothetical protein
MNGTYLGLNEMRKELTLCEMNFQDVIEARKFGV